MKKYSRLIILSIILIILVASGAIYNHYFYRNSTAQISQTPFLEITSSPPQTAVPSETPIPNSFEINNFSFQSQAPNGNWDELHDEACEEATLVLVKYHFENKTVTPEIMENEIQKIVAWEIEKFGSHKDLTVEDLAIVAEQYYKMSNFEIGNNLTIEDIKNEISKNHPLIIPTAGRLLGNPHFRSPGPIYHMVVAIGYNQNDFIVQDVGTKRGDHYSYNLKIFYNAIHDWNGLPDNINSGPKSGLIFY